MSGRQRRMIHRPLVIAAATLAVSAFTAASFSSWGKPMSYFRAAIRKMSAYVPGEQPQEAGYVKLNQNENPYPPSPRALAALREELAKLPLYPEPSSRRLREAAAEVYGVSPEQIMAVNGSDEILRILCQASVGEGDEIVAFEPGFTLYQSLAAVQGAVFRALELAADYSLPAPLPDLSAARLVFLPNPNTPSGTLCDEAEIRCLLEAAPQALVVVDEAYADFAGVSAIPLLAEYPNLVITRSLSKSYSLAGLRLGLGIASPALLRELHKARDFYNLDRLAQAAGAAALGDQDHLKKNVGKIVATRERLRESLRGLGIQVWPSQANFVLARCGKPAARKLYAALKERKILVRHFDRPRLDDCLRISVGTDAEIDTFLAALRELLAAS